MIKRTWVLFYTVAQTLLLAACGGGSAPATPPTGPLPTPQRTVPAGTEARLAPSTPEHYSAHIEGTTLHLEQNIKISALINPHHLSVILADDTPVTILEENGTFTASLGMMSTPKPINRIHYHNGNELSLEGLSMSALFRNVSSPPVPKVGLNPRENFAARAGLHPRQHRDVAKGQLNANQEHRQV